MTDYWLVRTQIVLIIGGLFALFKGEMKIWKNRYVLGIVARAIGAALLVMVVLRAVFDWDGVVLLWASGIAGVIGIFTSRKTTDTY